MNKPDFEKAANDHGQQFAGQKINVTQAQSSFLAGCEHAYSIDKETIERLEKENKELKVRNQELEKEINKLVFAHNDMIKSKNKEIDKLHGMWEASERMRVELEEKILILKDDEKERKAFRS